MSAGVADQSEKSMVAEAFRVMLPYYVEQRPREESFLAQKRLALRMLEGRCGRILDLGCGPGLLSTALVNRGWEVWGVDLAHEMLATARRVAAEAPWAGRVHYVAADADHLAFPDRTFDAVIAMGVLEYLPSVVQFLIEMRRMLKPDGLLIISVPSRVAPHFLVATALHRWVVPFYRWLRRSLTGTVRRGNIPAHPSRPVIPWTLDRTLSRAGFQKLESAFVGFIFYPLDRWFPGLSRTIARRCAVFECSPIFGYLGSQYLVSARKVI